MESGTGVLPRIAAVLCLSALAAAQEPQQPSFRSGTGVIVPIFATVSDREQRLVTDLEREDFEIFDNDKPQPLVVFQNETQPISVVVMLDTSASMTLNLKLLKDAAEQFIIRLFPGDRAKVGAFNDKIEVSAHFSDDRDALNAEIRNLDFGNGTRLYDGLSTSLDELKGIEGRRVVLVFTDGEDTSSRIGLGQVVDRARAEDVMVYAIGLESEFFNGQRLQRSRPDRGLRRLADETGGGYFELKKTTELAATFTRVAQELHSQYVLGFEATQLDGKVHRLQVRLKQPGMTARARRSYLAAPGPGTSTGK
jgi:Ca-activated chloride channel family protein